MTLTRRRVGVDSAFAEALVREGMDAMLAGDDRTGKEIQRDYIKATVGSKSSARRPTCSPRA